MLKQIIPCTAFLFCVQTGFSQGHYLKGALSYGVQRGPEFNFSKEDKTTVVDMEAHNLDYFYQLGYVKEKANNVSLEFLVGGRPGNWEPQYDRTPTSTTKIGSTLTGNVHLQVERKRMKCFDEKRKSSAYFGTFMHLGYDYHYFKTAYNSFYSSSTRFVKAKMGIIPGTQVAVGKRLVIDFNIAVSLISLGKETRNVENPDVSESAQKVSVFKMDLPMEAILRVGIAYRI